MKGKKVLVLWRDAESTDHWDDVDEHITSEVPLIETYGIVLDINKMGLVIAQNMDKQNNNASMIMRIPKGMIEGVYPLTIGKRPLKF